MKARMSVKRRMIMVLFTLLLYGSNTDTMKVKMTSSMMVRQEGEYLIRSEKNV